MSSSLLSLFFFAFAATVVSFSSGAGAYTISDCGPCECRPGEDLVLPARIGTDGCPVCICKPIPGAIDRAIDSFAGVAAGSFDFKGLVSATGGLERVRKSRRRRKVVRCLKWRKLSSRFFCIKKVKKFSS